MVLSLHKLPLSYYPNKKLSQRPCNIVETQQLACLYLLVEMVFVTSQAATELLSQQEPFTNSASNITAGMLVIACRATACASVCRAEPAELYCAKSHDPCHLCQCANPLRASATVLVCCQRQLMDSVICCCHNVLALSCSASSLSRSLPTLMLMQCCMGAS